MRHPCTCPALLAIVACAIHMRPVIAGSIPVHAGLSMPTLGGTHDIRWRTAAQPLAFELRCIYSLSIKFAWSERKRSLNLKQHGLDFVDAPSVFAGLTFTFEDDRFSCQE